MDRAPAKDDHRGRRGAIDPTLVLARKGHLR